MKISNANSSAQILGTELFKALDVIPKLDRCALLDYPEYQNAGDHFIWIACANYLRSIKNSNIAYAASFQNFSNQQMDRAIEDGAIFFTGGGNLGDLWEAHQLFRERVVDANHQRPIFIFPQTIYFHQKRNLERASRSFNKHPNLTIFTRDAQSLEIARSAFFNCQSILAPDMVYSLGELERPELVDPESANYRRPRRKTLFLCRDDQETAPGFVDLPDEIGSYTKDGWFNLQEKQFKAGRISQAPLSAWNIPGVALLYREIWQRRLHDSALWHSRTAWRQKLQAQALLSIPNTRRSLFILHDAICQISDYSHVITNRLHGHILSDLLGIPNILLPNSYGKNAWFWETWNKHTKISRFASTPDVVSSSFSELIPLS